MLLKSIDAKLTLLEKIAIRCVGKECELTTLKPLSEMRSRGNTLPICKRGRLRKRPVTKDPLIDAGSRESDVHPSTEFMTVVFITEKEGARILSALLL